MNPLISTRPQAKKWLARLTCLGLALTLTLGHRVMAQVPPGYSYTEELAKFNRRFDQEKASITSKDPKVRQLAAHFLGSVGWRQKEALPILARLVQNDESSLVRQTAIRGLGNFGYVARDKIGLITDALDDKNNSIRVEAAYDLARIIYAVVI